MRDGNENETTTKKDVNDRSKWTVIDAPQDTSLIPTLAVTLWLGWMGFLVKMSIFVVFLAPRFYKMVWVGVCTLSYMLPPHFPGPYGKLIGEWIMKHAERYFGLKTTIEDHQELQKIAEEKALIFAKEPHDILPYSVFCFADALGRVLPNQSLAALTTGAIFHIPFIKQVYSWVGCFPVDKKTFKRRLDRSESFCFVPGGAQEVLMLSDISKAKDKQSRGDPIPLYLKNRKGFLKLALTSGSPIVPTFAFGLDRSYDYWIPWGLSGLSRKMGFVPVMFTGRFGIPFGIPKPTKIHVVIGKPILLPKVNEDDDGLPALVEKYHALFLEEMEALYERHKVDEGYGHRKLSIF